MEKTRETTVFENEKFEIPMLDFLSDFTPLPSNQLYYCSYTPDEPASLVYQSSSPVKYELEDIEDEITCESCELDTGDLSQTGGDSDDYEDDDDDDDSKRGLPPPESIILEGAAENQIFLEGLDENVSGDTLQKMLQSGLLNTDTFSAEERHRRPLSDDNVSKCKCQVSADETVCTLNSAYCNSLPKTDVPSGVLEVSGTNISYLGVNSLMPYKFVSVLKLDNNQLNRVDPGTFDNMTALRNLSLSFNKLTALDGQVFKGATNLLELLVSHNKFHKLTQVTQSLTRETTPYLRHLNVGGNKFRNITRQDFAPMTGLKLQDLQLHENGIEHIDMNSFRDLRHLRRLRLRHNPVDLDELRDLIHFMQNSTLEMIDISGLGKYMITDMRQVLDAIAITKITALQLNNYCFQVLTAFHFPRMINIKALTMSNCGLHTLYSNTFLRFPALQQLILRDNDFSYVPDAVILPQLQALDLSRTTIRSDIPFHVKEYKFRDMNSLRYLDLTMNNIQKLDRGAFVGLENLTTLILDNTELAYIEEFSFSMMENLSELYLSHNPLGKQDFEFTWPGLTNLKILFLDNCSISNAMLYFYEMPRLERIKMNNNQLRNVTDETFFRLNNLQAVDLSYNMIEPWDKEIFPANANVTRIYLNNNNIEWVTLQMMDDFRNARVLTLRDNPYLCDCMLYDWLMWELKNIPVMNSTSAAPSISTDVDSCLCHRPPPMIGVGVLDFYRTSDHSPCRTELNKEMLFTMISMFLSGIFVAVLARYGWKNRWYLRYWLFKITSHRWLKKIRGNASGYLYDAFVSYSSEDANFVIDLMDNIEKSPPYYKLCVYERDFEIGNVISECILESINTSRKTILILTDHFAKSHWCRWEMSLVQCRLYEQKRDDLILVKLGKIRHRHLTPTIKYLMRTRIYIEWGPSAQQQLLFWEKLRAALKQPSGLHQLPRSV